MLWSRGRARAGADVLSDERERRARTPPHRGSSAFSGGRTRIGVGRVLVVRMSLVVGAVVAGLAGIGIVTSTEAPSAPPLVFGIYPGGLIGTVGPKVMTRPENAELRLLALQRLRGGDRPFVVRLYTAYRGRAAAQALDGELLLQMQRYTAAGFRIELVLTYRPVEVERHAPIGGYVDFVRRAVRRVGYDQSVVSLQITNEANVRGAPDASDGSYPGAREALVRGVIAAKDEVRRHELSWLRVGFNWAYERGRAADAFWRGLARVGGRSFADAVDWVGLDVYPGTWGPALPGNDLASAVRDRMIGALRSMRRIHLKEVGIPDSVALHVSENGYPTGGSRNDATQAIVAAAAIHAVHDVRGAYHVTDYRWFDLRDADSANSNIESQYGLMRDDYTPKAAFATYQALVAKLAASSAG